MDKVRITSDSPSYLKISEIGKELRVFADILEDKYSQVNFDFLFCFRALYTTEGIKSKVRFEKDSNYLGMDLIMSEDNFKPYKNNVSMQRRIMGKYFFLFFAENIKKYKSKLPSLKPVAEDLIEDMRLFLIENLWLPEENGSLKLSVIKNVPFERAMSLFGNPKQKKFTNNKDNQKVQSLVWEIDEKTQLLANYALINKKWVLQSFKIE